MGRLDGVSDEAVLATYADASRPAGERETAFHELVTRYQRRLFAVCYRVLRSTSDAEDAVQETFVRLARTADRFRGDAALSTWLYRVARNVCTDHVRYDARRPATPVADVVHATTEPEADDVLGARETGLAVEAALARLDERSRTLLLLVAVDGLSYAEAAEVVDLPVGTVKSRVSRARAALGQLLSSDEPAPPTGAAGRTLDTPRDDPDQEVEARGPPA